MVYKVVFFGTPPFAATILEFLAKQNLQILAVVTNPDKPIKRSKEPIPSPVKKKALELSIPLYQPVKASSEEFVSFLKTLGADLFIVVAYSEIFKQNFLDAPPLGCLNVHASLLPKYRGAAPIQRAIWAGEKESGVSIMKLVPKMDAGDVYKQVKISITEEMTAGELSEQLAKIGGPALFAVLQEMERGEARLEKQDETKVTFAPKLHSEDGQIDFSKSAGEIFRQILACTPKPGAWCFIEHKGVKKRLLIKKAKKVVANGEVGALVDSEEGRLIVCAGKDGLEFLQVQLESKKEMSGKEFLRGIGSRNFKFISEK